MKLRTIFALGVGYAIGAKLGPDRLDALARDVLDRTPGQSRPPMPRDVDAGWPDASFRL